MQSSTKHLHLGFDIKNLDYKINGATIKDEGKKNEGNLFDELDNI
ncbi:hypothetical protein [Mariniflexile sp. HMF6888]